ncbi:MAG TPA: methyl-accepting chemotaxis protein [Nitrospirota bacterium]
MKKLSDRSLKTRAILAVSGILLLVLVLNTLATIAVATSGYREALIARAAALAEGIRKDINKTIGFGIPLNALEGLGEKLRALTEEDQDLSGALVMDLEGKVLYASDRALENTVLSDTASRKALEANAQIIQFYRDKTGGHYEEAYPLVGADGKKIGVFRIAVREGAVNRQVRSLIGWSLFVGVLCFAAATILVQLFIDRRITGPIAEMSKTAGLLALGDLSHEVAVTGGAEIAALGNAINTMSSNLREMLSKLKAAGAGLDDAMKMISGATLKLSEGAQVQQEATEQTAMVVNEMVASNKGIAENAGEMSQAAADASSSASELASSIGEVASNTSELAVSAEDTASSIEQMIASIRQVSENTDALSASAEQTSSSVTEMSASIKEVEHRAGESARLAEKVSDDVSDHGMATAAEAIKGMQNIKDAVEATAEVLNRLGKRSQEIGQILKVIDEVTDQTGLLALNAAILASQAGEHGKGFAVVAEEIKDLAERTAASTQEIASLIVSVRDEAAASVQAMGRGLKAVEAGVDLVNVTSDMFEQVADSSRQSAESARAIEKATAEQARSVAQITETSLSIAGQIERIAGALQEQRKGSARIAQAADRMRTITRQVKTTAQEQTAGGRQIANAIESVTHQTSQVARSTAEQSQGAEQISGAIGKIQRITQDAVDVSIEMDMAVQTLKQRAEELRAGLGRFTF